MESPGMTLASFDPSGWLLGRAAVIFVSIFALWFVGELLVTFVKWFRHRQRTEV